MNFKKFILSGVYLVLALASADAVILFGTDDPWANTTAPTGALAGSGWQYEGRWGVNSGTPIAPNYFITADHVGGGVGQTFYFKEVPYTTTAQFKDPASDLRILQVAQTFAEFAPLYDKSDEVARALVVIGRGTQRGNPFTYRSSTRGWSWGFPDSVQRWGQNVVAQIVSGGANNDFLYATFDQQGGAATSASANEAHLSSGDSGGAVFLNDGGTWKLAGINYAVDGPFYTSPADPTGFTAALFDVRNFFYKNASSKYVLITGKTAVPTGFYATRISTKVSWIRSIIGQP